MRIASLSVACAGAALAASLALAHPPGHGPDKAEGQAKARAPGERNLQVLPKDIENAELMGLMQDFTRALGVECSYCHTRDFASDANPHKDVARGMMRMTARINDELLPAVPGLHRHDGDAHDGQGKVTCQTCHRGETKAGVQPPPPPPPTIPVPPAPPVPERLNPDLHVAPDTPAKPH